MRNVFFEREVAGEEPLTRVTATTLCELAASVAKAAPWLTRQETDLVLVRDGNAQVHTVSVMGWLGEFRAVAVYVGAEGYRFFERMQASARERDLDLLLGQQRSVLAEFSARGEIDKEDRALLKEVAPDLLRGRGRVPVFRSVRPGYTAWFVTEEEGRLLTLGLQALLHMLSVGGPSRQLGPTYPLVEWKDGAVHVREGEPPRTAETIRVAAVDHDRVRKIKTRFRKSKDPVIVDHFYALGKVGQPEERKMAMRLTVALDGATGMALAPTVSSPAERTEDLLAQTTLSALERARRIPATIVVRKEEYGDMLRALADELGFKIQVVQWIAPLEEMKAMLLVGLR